MTELENNIGDVESSPVVKHDPNKAHHDHTKKVEAVLTPIANSSPKTEVISVVGASPKKKKDKNKDHAFEKEGSRKTAPQTKKNEHVSTASPPHADEAPTIPALSSIMPPSPDSGVALPNSSVGPVGPVGPVGTGGAPATRSLATRGGEGFRISMDGSVSPVSSTKDLDLEGMACKDSKPIESTWSCTRNRMIGAFFLCLVVVAAAVAVPLVLFQEETNTPNDGVERLSSYEDDKVVSELPIDLCNEGHPGEGKSAICTPSQTARNGGVFCNLVAQAIMNVTGSDVVIINAGVCMRDINGPNMSVADIRAAVATTEIEIVEASGGTLLQALEQAMNASFGEDTQDVSAYPYAAGLRYNVSANLEFGNRVPLAEIDVDHLGLWRPVNRRRFYKIATTADLSSGAMGCDAFAGVIHNWKTPLAYSGGDALLDYALREESWWELKPEEYSTQSFVGADVEPTIAEVPETICLEWTPGSGKSDSCSVEQSILRGGGVCNLVAWGLLDQNLGAQMALLRGGDCGSDIEAGAFTESTARAILPNNPGLVTVKVTGVQVISILSGAIDAVLDQARDDAYPYAAGLRFVVDSTAPGSRLSSIESFTARNRWVPLDISATYTLLTSSDLANGEDSAYEVFRQVDISSIQPRDGSLQTFMNFASEWKVLYDPPVEKYSTQQFIS